MPATARVAGASGLIWCPAGRRATGSAKAGPGDDRNQPNINKGCGAARSNYSLSPKKATLGGKLASPLRQQRPLAGTFWPRLPSSNGHQTHRHGCDEPTCKARHMGRLSSRFAPLGRLLATAANDPATRGGDGTGHLWRERALRSGRSALVWAASSSCALRCPIIEAILAAHSVGSVQHPLSVIHLTPSDARNPFRQRL